MEIPAATQARYNEFLRNSDGFFKSNESKDTNFVDWAPDQPAVHTERLANGVIVDA